MINEFDLKIIKKAIEISKKCPDQAKKYSVGAVILDQSKNIISTGYSREVDDSIHAEEMAIRKAAQKGIDLKGMTIYSTMEPCGLRLSGQKCCADRIIESGITRVVYGIDEPPYFVQDCTGAKKLREKDIIVEQITDPKLKKEIECMNEII